MIELTATKLVVALISAFVMGIAIQRGATCMVAAVDEMVSERRFARAGALLEASLWVGGLVAFAMLLGWAGALPAHFQIGPGTFAGGALLGLGAWINRACVFGSVARIGNGQWAWLATPLGFFAGCLVPVTTPSSAATGSSSLLIVPIAIFFSALFAWRIIEAAKSGSLLEHLWHPYRATLLIGLTFFTTMLTVGAWAYTDGLAEIARMTENVEIHFGLRGIMVLALFAGAVAGGWIAGAIRLARPALKDVVRCFAGGTFMGIGAGLVPGSNDSLIMLGLPLLLPHAWIAVLTMGVTIAIAIKVSSRVQPKEAI